MINQIKKMLGIKPGADFSELLKNGAQVVDVRSREEYASGHLQGSVNIPLHELIKFIGKISKNKPVIVCCASGVRSSSAKSVLKTKGFEVHNGGAWQSLLNKIK